ncbi:MAG: GTPase [Planctomycetota bacterium]|jgi:ribosome-interacting GTPase 1
MAVNLTPQYHEAESHYKKASSPAEKLEWLKQMWVLLPKHKASEKLQADIKTRMSDLREEVEKPKSTARKLSAGRIQRQGSGQIAIIGSPNSGKSQLLASLTAARPDIAPYPFTTRAPQAGMMEFENIKFQLIDTPPITSDQLDQPTISIIRQADSCLLAVDLSDDDGYFAAEVVVSRLAEAGIFLSSQIPEGIEDWAIHHVRAFIIGTKCDSPGATERLEVFRELSKLNLPIIALDCLTGTGLANLGATMFKLLDIIRVFPKKPGKPAEKTSPITIRKGDAVQDFAAEIHGDLPAQLKAARVWGPSAPHDGQTVPRDHVLMDGDTVELQV